MVDSMGLLTKTPKARITSSQSVLGGTPCITNTHIPVRTIYDSKVLGMSDSDLLSSYPDITEEDLVAVYTYIDEHGIPDLTKDYCA